MKKEFETFEWCHKNHLKFGWDNGDFWFSHTKAMIPEKSLREECMNAVVKIRESMPKKILINLSGGIDSEIVARCMLEKGIDFKAQIWEFKDHLNDHDISRAHAFCDENNIDRRIIKFDIVSFLESEIYDIVKKYPSPFWAMPMHQKMVELTPKMYYSIFAEGHLVFYYCNPENEIELYGRFFKIDDPKANKYKYKPFIFEMENATNVTLFMQEQDKIGCPRFFKYTPQLMLAYMRHNRVKQWMKYNQDLAYKNRVDELFEQSRITKDWDTYDRLRELQHKYFTSKPRKWMLHDEFPEMPVRRGYGGLEHLPEGLKDKVSANLRLMCPLNSTGTKLVPFGYDELEKSLRCNWDDDDIDISDISDRDY